jgi:hypothetical protein
VVKRPHKSITLEEKMEVVRRMEGRQSCRTFCRDLNMAPSTETIMERMCQARQTTLNSYFKKKSEMPPSDSKISWPWQSTSRTILSPVTPIYIYISLQNGCDITFMFKIHKCFFHYFMKDSLNFCILRTHPIEIHNSSTIYTDLIHNSISRNLTLT